MHHVELPIFSVQHHPEAGPGPNDSVALFMRFREMIEESKPKPQKQPRRIPLKK
jgi:carbamoylphosphate synthase small subunit